jgi:hypothetical protein
MTDDNKETPSVTVEAVGTTGRVESIRKGAPLFHFESIADLFASPDQQYLVERWIPDGGVGLLYGRWASGKSFMGYDIALHLAYGLPDWHGARLPGVPCDVLVIAREGKAGFRKRIDAFKVHHGLEENTERVVLLRSPISFLDDHAFERLKRSIKASNRSFRFILIDTVARVLSGEEMGKEAPITLFMERLQQISDLTGATALGVHHKNKSGDANGSAFFQNNSDFMFSITRLGPGHLQRAKIVCEKDKEGEDQWSREITFAKVELPGSRSSLVVASVSSEQVSMPSESKRERPKEPSKRERRERRALDALDAVILSHGVPLPAGVDLPGGRAVDLDHWRDELISTGIIDGKKKNPRADFKRIKDGLADGELIGERDGLVWRAKQ